MCTIEQTTAIEPTTAILVFHPGGDGPFGDWADTMVESASAAPGHIAAWVSVAEEPFEPAVAVHFGTSAAVDDWLDSAQCAEVMRAGAALGWRSAAPALLLDGVSPPPPGIGAFRHQLVAGRLDEFLESQSVLTAAARGFSGYEGTSLFVQGNEEALSVLRFRTDRQLVGWTSSRQRETALPSLRSSLRVDFAAESGTTAFGTTVRTDGGRVVMTPNWKSAMLVLLVLYPTVMLLSRFLGPQLDRSGAAPWLALWLSQVASVILMQWWLMPWASKPFRRWLDPVDGSGRRTNVAGAAVIALVYAVTLWLFGAVRWLQYWDYAG
ncbi:antibiotic biosynthesis monooxygenase [Mycolicibacterium sp. 22603]|uniref:antibiotic biosynthesis monooxygenase n=1 Tax=Mycolicibacterium sp. 22603 TaxID=3453950 RepID=UPI003F85B085